MRRAVLALAVVVSDLACASLPSPIAAPYVAGRCLPLVSASASGSSPICVTGGELATAVAAYVRSHDGAAPTLAAGVDAETAPVDLYAALEALPAARSRSTVTCASSAPVLAP